jgi:crossover junction endodeoxyribonuclease RuvC
MSINPSQTNATPLTLGIDPGYDRLGWAVAAPTTAGWENIHLGCIQTNRQNTLIDRYKQLDGELQGIIDKYKPTQAGIETVYFANNTNTAMKIAEVRGIIIACLLRNNVQVDQYNPVKIKQAMTGNGKAYKKAMEKMVKMEFKLDDQPYLDDALDALAVLFTHHLYQRNKKFLA